MHAQTAVIGQNDVKFTNHTRDDDRGCTVHGFLAIVRSGYPRHRLLSGTADIDAVDGQVRGLN